jgi:hypothetical protein
LTIGFDAALDRYRCIALALPGLFLPECIGVKKKPDSQFSQEVIAANLAASVKAGAERLFVDAAIWGARGQSTCDKRRHRRLSDHKPAKVFRCANALCALPCSFSDECCISRRIACFSSEIPRYLLLNFCYS